jgi:hypothetical protein
MYSRQSRGVPSGPGLSPIGSFTTYSQRLAECSMHLASHPSHDEGADRTARSRRTPEVATQSRHP